MFTSYLQQLFYIIDKFIQKYVLYPVDEVDSDLDE